LDTAKLIVKAASELGIKYVTLYVFSTENWKRMQDEVNYLMGLIKLNLRAEFNFYKQNKMRIKHLGNLEGLPKDVQNEIIQAVNKTSHFDGLTVTLAINYGGRDEIVRGIQKLLAKGTNQNITEKTFEQFFDVPELPDVDLLIRTGGELRLSNFLLWHSAYAELIFTDTLWPDYTKEEFYKDIETFQNRTRRFGAVLDK